MNLERATIRNAQHYVCHGWGGHTTDKCEHLKKQVKKLKSGNETKDDDKKKSGDGKKDNNAKGKSNNQDGFVTFMNRTVQQAVSDAVSNKRKSDDDSTGSIAALDEIENVDLTEFDCQKMEQIVIEDNGDITI